MLNMFYNHSQNSNLDTGLNQTFNTLPGFIIESDAQWMRIESVWFAMRRLLQMNPIDHIMEPFAASAAEPSLEGLIKELKRSTNAKLVRKI